MNIYPQLPAIPENGVVTTWQPTAVPAHETNYQACFVSRLTSELATIRADNQNLQDMCKQASFESSCWRKEYEQLLAAHLKISEQHANLQGQYLRLREQVRSTKSKRTGQDIRRGNRGLPTPGSTETGVAVEEGSGSGKNIAYQDTHIKRESGAREA